jgi:hypothetical protein
MTTAQHMRGTMHVFVNQKHFQTDPTTAATIPLTTTSQTRATVGFVHVIRELQKMMGHSSVELVGTANDATAMSLYSYSV